MFIKLTSLPQPPPHPSPHLQSVLFKSTLNTKERRQEEKKKNCPSGWAAKGWLCVVVEHCLCKLMRNEQTLHAQNVRWAPCRPVLRICPRFVNAQRLRF